ncbi:MAG: helix-turn-helix domain-containing protein [Bacillota bacterium]|nr:helix-turn-helix domain-containing protein [Bacillota bacterium]
MNVSENIKKYRKQKNITQKDLARILNKSERMVQKYESGEVTPNLDVLSEIANALGVGFFELANNTSIEIDVPKNIEKDHKNKLDSVVLSVEKKIAVKEWVKNSSLKEILEEILNNNIELENLRNIINTLSDQEGESFKSINNIPIEDYNMESSIIVLKNKSAYIKNTISKILLLLNFEETKLSNLLKSNKDLNKY